jgi:hypothetical protein
LAPTRRSLGQEIARKVDGSHHGEVQAVHGARSISEPAHRLVHEARHSLQLARMRIGPNRVLLPEYSNRNRLLASHFLDTPRCEAPFDLIDLSDEIIDALGNVGSELIALTNLCLELREASFAGAKGS